MPAKLKIKKGDSVEVIYGKDKGRRGTVLEIDSNRLQVKVQGVRVQTHFDKKEGLQQKEGFIHYSNIKAAAAAPSTKKTKKKKKKKTASAQAG